MALSMKDALNRYGWIAQLATAIPELKDTLTQAEQAGWAPDEFQRQLEGSPWWQKHADSVRQLAILQATDPATYQQNLANAANKIQLAASQMGRSVDANSLALQMLTYNWDDQQLNAVIGSKGSLQHGANNSLVGDAAQYTTHMKQLAADYGITATDSYLNGQLTAIQSGKNTLDGFEQSIRNQAKATFPQFAQQIDQGMTVRDIADPWISTMAKTLEVSDSTVDLNTPEVKKALTQRNADGSATAMPLWQFERSLKDDPRYDKTTQARTDAASVLHKVGQDFGFSS